MLKKRKHLMVGNRYISRRYIGNKKVFENLTDKTEVLSGEEIYTDKADEGAVVHVGIDGKSYQEGVPSPDSPIEIHSLNDFDVVSSTEKLSEGQLEEYNYDTEYENVYKINLLLDEPLRSVGDVKDRLFRDSDGLWKIQRNVGELMLDDTKTYTIVASSYQVETSALFGLVVDGKNGGVIYSSHLPHTTTRRTTNGTNEEEGLAMDGVTKAIGRIRFRVWNSTIGATNSDTWEQKRTKLLTRLSTNPIQVVYELETPTTENLDQESQDKLNNLRSFQGSNYVYTVLDKTDILPTLHTTFKSKGWYDYYKKTLLK